MAGPGPRFVCPTCGSERAVRDRCVGCGREVLPDIRPLLRLRLDHLVQLAQDLRAHLDEPLVEVEATLMLIAREAVGCAHLHGQALGRDRDGVITIRTDGPHVRSDLNASAASGSGPLWTTTVHERLGDPSERGVDDA